VNDPLLRFRPEFPILERTTYLISNSLGAMPARVRERMDAFTTAWATRGARAWYEGWWEMSLQTGDLLAPILGTGLGEVTFHQNVSIAVALFVSALDLHGKRVVTTEMEFPSVGYVLHENADVVVVRSHDGIAIDEDELCAAIDERTGLVVLSHVLFKSAYVMDAAAIAARAHETGALVLLDVFQSAGVMPVDVRALGVDAAVGGCLKWLCGGPGNAFLWVRPELHGLEPRLTGWQAHEDPFAFAPGPIRRRSGAGRFLTGTPNIAALYAAAPGLEIVAEAGVEAIRAKSTRQTTRLIELFDAHGWRVNASRDPARRGGTIAVDVRHGEAVAAALNAADVCVDYRPGAGVRLSPHLYTTEDELEIAAEAIEKALAAL
jgi:kynureninase